MRRLFKGCYAQWTIFTMTFLSDFEMQNQEQLPILNNRSLKLKYQKYTGVLFDFFGYRISLKYFLHLLCSNLLVYFLGLTSSSIFMNGATRYHLEVCKPKSNLTEIIKQLIWNLYVDDSTNSFDNAQEAVKFYEK